MNFVRTVLGDIYLARLGVCYAHEHIIIDTSYATQTFPDFHLPSVEKGIAELSAFYTAGGRAMVDSMPCDAGRNVRKLAIISDASGVHIICPTGLHLAKYYPEGHWGGKLSAEELAQVFIAEIEEGIDGYDLGGPFIARTEHKAGLIKVAGGKDKLSEQERRAFAAAAIAQVETGCPILTHTEEGTAGLEQVEVLEENGADLYHVVLSHTDRLPDVGYHRELLQTGVRLEYDSAFRWKREDGSNPTLDLLVALLPEFPDQIMLGMDAARPAYWKAYGGGPGLSFLLGEFTEKMRGAGITEGLWQKVFVTTPAQVYAFGGSGNTG